MKIFFKKVSLTFGDVPHNRFFVDSTGRLAVKGIDGVCDEVGLVLTDSDGKVCTDIIDYLNSDLIRYILPEVEKIEF